MLPLVTLVASHISSPARADLLARQIYTVLRQSHATEVHVSVSGPLAPGSLQTLPAYDETDRLHVHAHGPETRLSQFEHYDYLCNYLLARDPQAAERTFCVFCDDDDVTHPERSLFYASCPDLSQHAMLARDAMLLRSSGKTVDGHEYFMFALRLGKLAAFCDLLRAGPGPGPASPDSSSGSGSGYLRSPVCDVLLGSAMFHGRKLHRRSATWLYAYDDTRPGKDSEAELLEYRRLVSDEKLMRGVEVEFDITAWSENMRGWTAVYGPLAAGDLTQ